MNRLPRGKAMDSSGNEATCQKGAQTKRIGFKPAIGEPLISSKLSETERQHPDLLDILGFAGGASGDR